MRLCGHRLRLLPLVFANGQIVDQRILFRRLLFILIHKIFPGIKAEICIKDLESKLPLG